MRPRNPMKTVFVGAGPAQSVLVLETGPESIFRASSFLGFEGDGAADGPRKSGSLGEESGVTVLRIRCLLSSTKVTAPMSGLPVTGIAKTAVTGDAPSYDAGKHMKNQQP